MNSLDTFQYIARLKQNINFRKILKSAEYIYIYVDDYNKPNRLMITYSRKNKHYRKVIENDELPKDLLINEPEMKNYKSFHCVYTSHPLAVDFYED